jgi:hypothetical protein
MYGATMKNIDFIFTFPTGIFKYTAIETSNPIEDW